MKKNNEKRELFAEVQKSTLNPMLTDSCLGTVLVQIPTLTVNISVNFSPILII